MIPPSKILKVLNLKLPPLGMVVPNLFHMLEGKIF